jgi:predicted RNA-binding protein with PIN domain
MAVSFLLIDGYNLLHAAGLARVSYGPGDLEVCRNRLIAQLAAGLEDSILSRTTVVFDAFSRFDDSERYQQQHGLSVVFAPAGTDADSEIERLIAAHDAPRQLLVVSSDHRLHKAAQKRKCQAIDSEPFWESLTDQSTDTGRTTSPHRVPSTTDWLQEFADVEQELSGGPDSGDGVFDADYLADLESEFDD